ncbi:hypothetical protein BUALT_Bualt01G0241100 [Buddleja alternifolia]|uniref:Uncharacterized protein n=1 Tax=Buddleja alternifolia TaxID=168488 RepID=A0AAV6Y9Q6_9LAMI|nr:hypothetical protein BUALT_Bualt01G0241100 [Buddleja alternifolia]
MANELDERELSILTYKLPLLHITSTTMHSPEHQSGTSTPPLQTTASVPFKWEEHPGKPRPCTGIIPEPAKSLDLPPCRMPLSDPPNKFTKTPSPTSVFDGPYNVGRPKFSSFRLFREGKDYYDSSSSSPDEGTAMHVLLGNKKSGEKKGRGLFGKLKGGKKEADRGSIGFSPDSTSSFDSEESCNGVNISGRKMRRNGSFSSVPHATSSHLLASIYEGFKQVMQWKSSRKPKKDGQQ